jgi:hypothetical protein
MRESKIWLSFKSIYKGMVFSGPGELFFKSAINFGHHSANGTMT